MNRRRAQCRRTQREADRKCLTAADVQRLNAARRLPDDYPPIARVLRDGLELSDAQMAQLRSDVEEVSYEHAQAVLSCVNASAEFKAWKRELTSHPGPVSILPPDIAMTAAVIAAERGNAWRSEVCRVVNGMDTRIWHAAGMCDNKTREPVSFNIVARQVARLEVLPSATHRKTHETNEETS